MRNDACMWNADANRCGQGASTEDPSDRLPHFGTNTSTGSTAHPARDAARNAECSQLPVENGACPASLPPLRCSAFLEEVLTRQGEVQTQTLDSHSERTLRVIKGEIDILSHLIASRLAAHADFQHVNVYAAPAQSVNEYPTELDTPLDGYPNANGAWPSSALAQSAQNQYSDRVPSFGVGEPLSSANTPFFAVEEQHMGSVPAFGGTTTTYGGHYATQPSLAEPHSHAGESFGAERVPSFGEDQMLRGRQPSFSSSILVPSLVVAHSAEDRPSDSTGRAPSATDYLEADGEAGHPIFDSTGHAPNQPSFGSTNHAPFGGSDFRGTPPPGGDTSRPHGRASVESTETQPGEPALAACVTQPWWEEPLRRHNSQELHRDAWGPIVPHQTSGPPAPTNLPAPVIRKIIDTSSPRETPVGSLKQAVIDAERELRRLKPVGSVVPESALVIAAAQGWVSGDTINRWTEGVTALCDRLEAVELRRQEKLARASEASGVAEYPAVHHDRGSVEQTPSFGYAEPAPSSAGYSEATRSSIGHSEAARNMRNTRSTVSRSGRRQPIANARVVTPPVSNAQYLSVRREVSHLRNVVTGLERQIKARDEQIEHLTASLRGTISEPSGRLSERKAVREGVIRITPSQRRRSASASGTDAAKRREQATPQRPKRDLSFGR